MWNYGFGYSPSVYVFRCAKCGALRANWHAAPAITREPRHM